MASSPLPVHENPLTRLSEPKRYAPVFGLLMTPVALTAYVMAAWRLGADLNLFAEFFISKGLLSRWQVWLALAVAVQMSARHLNKAADNDQTAGV